MNFRSLTLSRLLLDACTLITDLAPWPDHKRSCSYWSASPAGDFCDCGYNEAMKDFTERRKKLQQELERLNVHPS